MLLSTDHTELGHIETKVCVVANNTCLYAYYPRIGVLVNLCLTYTVNARLQVSQNPDSSARILTLLSHVNDVMKLGPTELTCDYKSDLNQIASHLKS